MVRANVKTATEHGALIKHTWFSTSKNKKWRGSTNRSVNDASKNMCHLFQRMSFGVMIEKAIKQEKLFRDPNSTLRKVDEGGRRGRPRRPPHESKLCEKCGYGNGKKCWER
ncbi:uncharacterized protein LOC121411423 isoform X2 [Lytechinus variegatus]|uniref:uncharacterized protein LOC121411423 isoform X2 n=1 Tax=Lytechinus variegatus TaxID=7654 RepID=UPI001BB0D9E7|nr:uncharacterized protein LOC121411423 isoform X2 [Lytechinus variegatus]